MSQRVQIGECGHLALQSVGHALQRSGQRLVDAEGSDGLALLVQQLWLPALRTGDVRVVVNPRDDPGWFDVERYCLMPSALSARLLVPAGPAAATSGTLVNYWRLRTPLIASGRLAAGAASRVRIPLGRDKLVVQVRHGTHNGTALLPLSSIARAIRVPRLYASLGVRTGANRKATLQMVDRRGTPAGYAKLAWNASTAECVRNEAEALARIGGRAGMLRAPGLLSTGYIGEHPYLVSEPLPKSVHASGRDQPMPTPRELATLCPLLRRSTVSATGQFAGLSKRIATLPDTTVGHELGAQMGRLVLRLTETEARVPVTQRWHGDLASWNTARDSDGRLWCWDWELSEDDAVAGLDALHWTVSRERRRPNGIDAETLERAVENARAHLRAAGLVSRDWPLVAAVYALTTAERVCSLSHATGWGSVWIDENGLAEFLASACAMLDRRSR